MVHEKAFLLERVCESLLETSANRNKERVHDVDMLTENLNDDVDMLTEKGKCRYANREGCRYSRCRYANREG